MRRRAVVVALVCAVGVGAVPAAAAPHRPARLVAETDRHAVRGDLGPATGPPLAVARRALTAHAEQLGVDAEAFRFDVVRRSLIGTHVRGRELRGGIPVEETFAAVHIVHGRVAWVQARDDDRAGDPAARPVPAAVAVRAALRRLGVRAPERVSTRRALVPRGDRLVDTWRVSVLSLDPFVAADVDIDASSGATLGVGADSRRVDGAALVFEPNPVVRTRNAKLRQPGESGSAVDRDLDSAELTAARSSLPLRDLDATGLLYGTLSGPHVRVQTPLPLPPGAPDFDLTRSDPRFEGLMAYAHLDRLQRHLHALGFTGERAVNAEPQDVYALRTEGLDNSAYLPSVDAIVLGAGGVDDGEDAEVIVHEYGHAIQDAQVPGYSGSGEAGVMGEGFGDVLAAAYFAPVSGGFGDTCMFDWDSTSFPGGEPRCIRRIDSAMTYDDRTGGKYVDSQIWSSFLWRLRDRLGRGAADRSDNVIRLVVASHELLSPTPTMRDGVAALVTAARALGRPEWVAAIRTEAARGRLPLPA